LYCLGAVAVHDRGTVLKMLSSDSLIEVCRDRFGSVGDHSDWRYRTCGTSITDAHSDGQYRTCGTSVTGAASRWVACTISELFTLIEGLANLIVDFIRLTIGVRGTLWWIATTVATRATGAVEVAGGVINICPTVGA
jgi:hypothetical protein